jgi:hypothetical protein
LNYLASSTPIQTMIIKKRVKVAYNSGKKNLPHPKHSV